MGWYEYTCPLLPFDRLLHWICPTISAILHQHRAGIEMTRVYSLLRRRLVKFTVFVVLLFFILLRITPAPRGLKEASTDFSISTNAPTWSSPIVLPEHLFRNWTGPSGLDLDERYLFVRKLGSGREGIVRLYNDTRTGRAVAIKTFHSQLRNRLPKLLMEAVQLESLTTWPAEIPATLLFGNSRLEIHDEELFSKHRLPSARLNTVPALDYFVVSGQGSRSNQAEWQLVTPYLGRDLGYSEGTLSDVAKRLKKEQKTPGELDSALRPGLHRLLGTLARMHGRGFVHTAIKHLCL